MKNLAITFMDEYITSDSGSLKVAQTDNALLSNSDASDSYHKYISSYSDGLQAEIFVRLTEQTLL